MDDKEKERILEEFQEKIVKQKDIPPDFKEVIDKEFWNLLGP